MPFKGRPARLYRGISGSFSAVMGLPVAETAQMLRTAGYPLMEGWS